MDRACCAVSNTGIQKLVSSSQLAFSLLRYIRLKFLLHVEFVGLSILMFVVLRVSCAVCNQSMTFLLYNLLNGVVVEE